jgi:hypothetical protein
VFGFGCHLATRLVWAQNGLILVILAFGVFWHKKAVLNRTCRERLMVLITSYILEEVFTKNAKMGHFLEFYQT